MLFLVTRFFNNEDFNLDGYTGKVGHLLYDAESNSIYYFDGKTLGGVIVGGVSAAAPTYSSNVQSIYLTNGQSALATTVNIVTISTSSMVIYPPPDVLGSTFKVYVTGVTDNNVLVIDFTASLLNGVPETYILNKNFGSTTFAYINPTLGWIITSTGL